MKHGVITKDDDEYKYLMKFIQLEIDLGIYSANVINNKSEMKKAVEKCKDMEGPRKITKEIAKVLEKN